MYPHTINISAAIFRRGTMDVVRPPKTALIIYGSAKHVDCYVITGPAEDSPAKPPTHRRALDHYDVIRNSFEPNIVHKAKIYFLPLRYPTIVLQIRPFVCSYKPDTLSVFTTRGGPTSTSSR